MKHNWECKKLEEVASIMYGFPFESGKFNTEKRGMPLIRIRDVKPGETETFFDGEYSPNYVVMKGDYLIGMDGEFNIAPWRSVDALLNQRVCRIESTPPNYCSSAFLYYFLGVELKKIEERTSFVTVKHLSAKVLNSISVPIPPMAVQEQIVAELDKLNEMIATRKEQLKELDNLAQSLFYDTFGDPVTNPKGWKVVKLSDVCSDITDGDHSAPPKSNNGVPFITISNIDKNKKRIDFSNCFYVPETYYETLKENRKPRIGDVLYTVTGSYGLTIEIRDNSSFCFQRHIGLIRPTKVINSTFLTHWGRSEGIKYLADKVATGIAQKTVSLSALRNFPLILPPLPLQQQFATQVEAIEKQKELVEASLSELQTLLDSRMDYWFN